MDETIAQTQQVIDFFDQNIAPLIGVEKEEGATDSGRQLKSLEANLAEARAALIESEQHRAQAEDEGKRNVLIGFGAGLALGWAIKKFVL